MKKQSSIEWLVSEIQRHIDAGYEFNPKHNEQLIDQAKELHKQEIIEAWDCGEANCIHRVIQERKDCLRYGDEYYKNTYEKEN